MFGEYPEVYTKLCFRAMQSRASCSRRLTKYTISKTSGQQALLVTWPKFKKNFEKTQQSAKVSVLTGEWSKMKFSKTSGGLKKA